MECPNCGNEMITQEGLEPRRQNFVYWLVDSAEFVCGECDLSASWSEDVGFEVKFPGAGREEA